MTVASKENAEKKLVKIVTNKTEQNNTRWCCEGEQKTQETENVETYIYFHAYNPSLYSYVDEDTQHNRRTVMIYKDNESRSEWSRPSLIRRNRRWACEKG